MMGLYTRSITPLFRQNSAKLTFDPYQVNPLDYRSVSNKLSISSAYSICEYEPFPRFQIMELSKKLLDKLNHNVSGHFGFKLCEENKITPIMEVTHKTECIFALEEKLEVDFIEEFIDKLRNDIVRLDDIIERMNQSNQLSE